MANWCVNSLIFSGAKENVKKVMDLFSDMERLEREEKEAQAPDFIAESDVDGYFFCICLHDNDAVSYETKWSPNIDAVTSIAKHFDVNFELQYEELGNCIFGKYIYTVGNEQAQDYCLEDIDFDQYEYNDEADSYIFRNETYESQYDILFTLFEERHGVAY